MEYKYANPETCLARAGRSGPADGAQASGSGPDKRDFIEKFILPRVSKPGRYVGGELNARTSAPAPGDLRFCLVFPDRYEIGMSYHGLQILYSLLNDMRGVAAERAFAPDEDMARELKRHGMPIFALESMDPLDQFHVLGFSLTYEMNYTNLLWILDMANIPLRAEDRTGAFPLVVAGGPCAANPEPFAPFVDAVVIGDGEEVLPGIIAAVKQGVNHLSSCSLDVGADPWVRPGRTHGCAPTSKKDMLRDLARIPGVYVPSLYEPRFSADGKFYGTAPMDENAPVKIYRQWVKDLDSAPSPEKPLVPNLEPVHSRIVLEAARGCRHGCRFCQAGFFYRPYRERSLEILKSAAMESYRNSGWEGFSILSLNATEYTHIKELTDHLMRTFAAYGVAISLPSTRFDSFSLDVLRMIQESKKTGITLAAEAGSQALRDRVNKNLSEDFIFEAVTSACEMGWNLVKLYFMVGLPGETDDDIIAAGDLIRRLAELRTGESKGRLRLHVAVAPFIPKPHTPFQWAPMAPMQTIANRIQTLKRMVPRSIKLNYHDVERSMLEALFCRGGRRLAKTLETAYRLGCRQDAWTDNFRMDLWRRALDATGVDLEAEVCGPRLPSDPMPWDHIGSGVDSDYLLLEARRAEQGQTTPACPVVDCRACGVCA